MKYINFGKDNLKISRFGLGCMRFPQMKNEKGEDVIDEQESIKMIRYAIDNGVNYIDTAYAYAGSEVVVGKALLDGYREKVVLVTKLPIWLVKEQSDLRKYLDEQLERLQTDYIDIYLLHNLYYENWEIVEKFNAIEMMKQFKEEKKIKYIAFSMHERLDHWKKVIDTFDWDMAMMQYNYFDKFNQAGIEGLKYATDKGVPVVIMESLHGGMLALEPPAEVANALALVKGDTYAEKAFRWLYNQPECKVMLSGCSSMQQLKENIEIFNNSDVNVLTDEEEKQYDKARDEWNKKTLVQCTACGYCMPCPQGVDIPEIFNIYNNTARAMDKSHNQAWLYDQVLVSSKCDASQCVECGICESHCPQRIEIINKLKEAHAVFTGK